MSVNCLLVSSLEQSGSDLKSMGGWFMTYLLHCVLSLSKTLYPLLSIDSTQEDERYCPDMTEKLLPGT